MKADVLFSLPLPPFGATEVFFFFFFFFLLFLFVCFVLFCFVLFCFVVVCCGLLWFVL